MKNRNSISIVFVLLFLAFAILVPGISAIFACYTVGVKPFFLGLGWLGLAAFIILLLAMQVLPYVASKFSQLVSIISGFVLFILSILLAVLMFCSAANTNPRNTLPKPLSPNPTTAESYKKAETKQITKNRPAIFQKVIFCELSYYEQITVKCANKMLKILEDGERVIVIFTTGMIYMDTLIKLRDLDSMELMKKIKTKNLESKDPSSLDVVAKLLVNLGFKTTSWGKFELPLGTPLKQVYELMRIQTVCSILSKHIGGCILYVLLQDKSQFGLITGIDKITELNE